MLKLKLIVDARIEKARMNEANSSNAGNDAIEQNLNANISDGIDDAMDDNSANEKHSVGAFRRRGRPKKRISHGGGRPSAGDRALKLKSVSTPTPTNSRQTRQIAVFNLPHLDLSF